MKKRIDLYCILFFCILLLPAILFLGGTGGRTQEEGTDRPSVMREDGSLNLQFLSQAGAFFEKNFGLRTWMVTADAVLEGRILKTSPLDTVIQGKNGWLYYRDSLEDYQAIQTLSDRSLFNLAHMLGMIGERMEEEGRTFLFTVAPNKNTLYDANMPFYIRRGEDEAKNLTRLIPFLEKEKVPYADLLQVFGDQEEVLYHARDSHWNNRGAALAADTLLEAAGIGAEKWFDRAYEVRQDFDGDLDKMLYPLAIRPESEIYYTDDKIFRYKSEIESHFDPQIETVRSDLDSSLVMYRDSFGNALLPFMADAFGEAYFSRGKPYDLNEVMKRDADTVIIETAERFLPEVVLNGAVLTAKQTEWTGKMSGSEAEALSEFRIFRQGENLVIRGVVEPDRVGNESRIFVRLYGRFLYEAVPMDLRMEDGKISDCGFTVYIPLTEVMTGDQQTPEEICADVLVSEGEVLHFVHKAMDDYGIFDSYFIRDEQKTEADVCDREKLTEVVG